MFKFNSKGVLINSFSEVKSAIIQELQARLPEEYNWIVSVTDVTTDSYDVDKYLEVEVETVEQVNILGSTKGEDTLPEYKMGMTHAVDSIENYSVYEARNFSNHFLKALKSKYRSLNRIMRDKL